jgi:hypothetical protein
MLYERGDVEPQMKRGLRFRTVWLPPPTQGGPESRHDVFRDIPD